MPRSSPRPPQQSTRIVAAGAVLLLVLALSGVTPSGHGDDPSASARTAVSDAPAPAGDGVDPAATGSAASAQEHDRALADELAATAAPDAPSAAAELVVPAVIGREAPEVGLLRRQRLERALERWLSEHGDVGSVGVGVGRSGDDAFAWTDDLAADEPDNVDAGDVFGILSVTKLFTEALVLRESLAGRIDLDGPMPALPGVEPVPEGEVITPRMLLQHTSGLVNYTNAEGYDPRAPMTPGKAVSLSLRSPRVVEPGTAARYSNSNFHWLGLLLEHVTSRGFGDLVAELAAAHGLTSTAFDATSRPGWVGFASGGMRSTLAEVVHWGTRLFTPDVVLPGPVLEEYRTVGPLGVGLGLWPICPCTTAPDGTFDYTAIGQMVSHGGILHFPDGDLVVAVRFERVPGDAGALTASLARALVKVADADQTSLRTRVR